MRKMSVPVTIATILCLLFAVGLPTVAAQDEIRCEDYERTYTDFYWFVGGPFVSELGQNQVISISSPSDPNKPVVIVRYDLDTKAVISETYTTLPITLSTANDSLSGLRIITQDLTDIWWTIVITCGVEQMNCGIADGRANYEDCGALVAIYPKGTVVDLYGIDPVSGDGVLVFSFDLATAGDVTENTLLAEGFNPFNGQPIRLYKLAGGGFQVNSTQPNGEPYEFAWS